MTENQKEKPILSKGRFIVLYVLLIIVLSFYIFRLFDYQIINGYGYVAQAEDNRTLEISDPSQRGIIYDRYGAVLARNIPSYNVVVIPARLPDSEEKFRKYIVSYLK